MSARWWPADRRFLRWAVPLAVVLALITVTGVTWAVNHESAAESDFLEPGSAAGIGGRTVAGRLGAAGVAVQRYTDTRRALDAAGSGGATVLVTAPDYMYPGYVDDLMGLPSTDRVVLVSPSALMLSDGGMPVRRTGGRWTTGVADPGCPDAPGGPAALVDSRYAASPPHAGTDCYDGGLVTAAGDGGPELAVVGAADVFRNDRSTEHDNARVATGLLSGRPRVVWLSLHRPESRYRPAPTPSENTATAHPRTADPGTPPPGTYSRDEGGSGDQSDNQAGGGGPPNPLWSAFPGWVWAAVVQVLIAAILLALWRARRLGAPATEPLPVVVRATETVTGRARLYHRARARRAALSALRAGTLRRLAPLLDLGPDPERRLLVVPLAERAGWPPDRVDMALYGPEPETDEQFRAAVAELDELVRLVHEERESDARGV